MSSIKIVKITDLKQGMYVVDTQPSAPQMPPLFSVEGYIMDPREPAKLKKQGYTHAYIDLGLSKAQEESATSVALPEETDISDITLGAALEDEEEELLYTHVEEIVEPEPDIELEQGALLDPSVPFEIENKSPYKEEQHVAKEVHQHVLDISYRLRRTVKEGIDAETVQEMQSALNGTVASITRNQDALLGMARLRNTDEYTFSHCVNVSIYAVVLGRRIRVKESSLQELALAGFLHDIGKMLIPQQILNFKGPLDADGMQIMQSHVERGGHYLENNPHVPAVVRTGVIEHHERYNGTGYPYGKRQNEISLVGQVLAVADIYDALTSERCYKKAFPPEKALAIMYKDRGETFSPGLLEMFIDAMGVYPVGNLVRLSNDYLAIVSERGLESPLRPCVVTLINPLGQVLAKPQRINLQVHRNITITHSVSSLPKEVDLETAVWEASLSAK